MVFEGALEVVCTTMYELQLQRVDTCINNYEVNRFYMFKILFSNEQSSNFRLLWHIVPLSEFKMLFVEKLYFMY